MSYRLILPLLIFLQFIPGFSGLLLIETAIAVVILGGGVCLLHGRGLIPGTEPYRLERQVQQREVEFELARIHLSTTRLRARETEQIDRIRALDSGEK